MIIVNDEIRRCNIKYLLLGGAILLTVHRLRLWAAVVFMNKVAHCTQKTKI